MASKASFTVSADVEAYSDPIKVRGSRLVDVTATATIGANPLVIQKLADDGTTYVTIETVASPFTRVYRNGTTATMRVGYVSGYISGTTVASIEAGNKE